MGHMVLFIGVDILVKGEAAALPSWAVCVWVEGNLSFFPCGDVQLNLQWFSLLNTINPLTSSCPLFQSWSLIEKQDPEKCDALIRVE